MVADLVVDEPRELLEVGAGVARYTSRIRPAAVGALGSDPAGALPGDVGELAGGSRPRGRGGQPQPEVGLDDGAGDQRAVEVEDRELTSVARGQVGRRA